MIYLPPMAITQGEPFSYSATVVGQDWTGYTGTVTIKRALRARTTLLTRPITADSTGVLLFSLTAEDTARLPSLPRQGYLCRAVAEIAMENAGIGDVQLYQAPVLIAGRI